jgi:hypothetical protein
MRCVGPLGWWLLSLIGRDLGARTARVNRDGVPPPGAGDRRDHRLDPVASAVSEIPTAELPDGGTIVVQSGLSEEAPPLSIAGTIFREKTLNQSLSPP